MAFLLLYSNSERLCEEPHWARWAVFEIYSNLSCDGLIDNHPHC